MLTQRLSPSVFPFLDLHEASWHRGRGSRVLNARKNLSNCTFFLRQRGSAIAVNTRRPRLSVNCESGAAHPPPPPPPSPSHSSPIAASTSIHRSYETCQWVALCQRESTQPSERRAPLCQNTACAPSPPLPASSQPTNTLPPSAPPPPAPQPGRHAARRRYGNSSTAKIYIYAGHESTAVAG